MLEILIGVAKGRSTFICVQVAFQGRKQRGLQTQYNEVFYIPLVEWAQCFKATVNLQTQVQNVKILLLNFHKIQEKFYHTLDIKLKKTSSEPVHLNMSLEELINQVFIF